MSIWSPLRGPRWRAVLRARGFTNKDVREKARSLHRLRTGGPSLGVFKGHEARGPRWSPGRSTIFPIIRVFKKADPAVVRGIMRKGGAL